MVCGVTKKRVDKRMGGREGGGKRRGGEVSVVEEER